MLSIHSFARQFVTALFSNAPSSVAAIVTPDFSWHGPSLMGKCGGDLPDLQRFVALLRESFSNFEAHIEEPIVEDATAVARWTIRGTHTGEGLAAPTGRLVQFTGIHMFRVVPVDERSWRVAELWQQWGQMGLLQHLEVIPFIGGPGTEPPGAAPATNGRAAHSNSASEKFVSVDKKIIQRLFDSVINEGTTALLETHIAEKITDHNPGPSDLPGRAGIEEVCKLLRNAFPNLNGTIDQLIAEGDKVVARWTVRGTNTCKCGGINATQRAMIGTGIDIVQLATRADGTRAVVARWGNSDDTGILIQLGLIAATA